MNDKPAGSPLLFSLIGTAHALEARMEEALEVLGLSLAKFGVMGSLASSHSPLTLSELAAKSSCVKSNITQLVDRLEADGLVRRVADSDDRRVTRAELTQVGRERQMAGAAVITEVQEKCLAGLPVGDQASLGWALRRLA